MLRLADTIADTVAQLEDTTVRIHGEAGRRTADTIVLPEFDAVQEYVNAAIRDGLQSAAVRSYLERMGFDTDAYDPLTEEIDRLGTLSPASARDIRLEHARRLEADVLQVQSVTDD
nr:hypothetical protein [Salinibaculum sp. KK48]